MIQRIQTVYLLIIVVLSSITLFLPNAQFLSNPDFTSYIFNLKGLYGVNEQAKTLIQNIWVLTTIKVLITFISLFTILKFKNRILQIRLTIFNMVLMLGYYPILFIYLWLIKSNFKIEYSVEFVSIFYIVNVVLSILAIRAIGKDEALVKSLNRLR